MSVSLLSVLLLTSPWLWFILFPEPAGSFCSSLMDHTRGSTLFSTPKAWCGHCRLWPSHSFHTTHGYLCEEAWCRDTCKAACAGQSLHLPRLWLQDLLMGLCGLPLLSSLRFHRKEPQKHWRADSRYELGLMPDKAIGQSNRASTFISGYS